MKFPGARFGPIYWEYVAEITSNCPPHSENKRSYLLLLLIKKHFKMNCNESYLKLCRLLRPSGFILNHEEMDGYLI